MLTIATPHSGHRRFPTSAVFAAILVVSFGLAAIPRANATTTTFKSIDGEDGWLLESTESSNVGGSKNAGGSGAQDLRAGDAAGDKQYKALVSFDTASIPDGATITSAQLRLRRGTTVGTNPFTVLGVCRVDIKGGNGFGGSVTLANGDFEAAADATQVATLSNALANGDWSEGTLNATGRSFINKTGKTQLRVYFATGDNDDGAADNIGWYGGGDIDGNRPQLVVTYDTGGTPPPPVVDSTPALFFGMAPHATDGRYPGSWPTVDTIVYGWDWTWKPDTTPATLSGVFRFGGESKPAGFPGNYLKLVNAEWRDLEPTAGNYTFTALSSSITDSAFDGAMLNVRGVVWGIDWDDGTPVFTGSRTAPDWLLSGNPPTIQEAHKHDFQITNVSIANSTVKNGLKNLAAAFGNAGIPALSKLKVAIIHGVSSTLGEEWTGLQSSQTGAEAAMLEIMQSWATAYGANKKKMGWMNAQDEIWDYANSVGAGSRGGAIENWLMFQYTPGNPLEDGTNTDEVGQILTNAAGQHYATLSAAEKAAALGWYLKFDETLPSYVEGRHFGDQNEVYDSRSATLESAKPRQYRHATLRALQMRRNVLAISNVPAMNPQIDNWLSLQLGKTAATTPDAWVLLMRTWARSGAVDREINNLERWLYQRPYSGATTTPTIQLDHGQNMNAANLDDGNGTLDYANVARRPATTQGIGIGIATNFLSTTGSHNVCIKVTYMDSGTGAWTLDYTKGDLTAGQRSVTKSNTGKVRTVSFFIPDLKVLGNGVTTPSFFLKSTSTDFMFARVVKN